MAVVGIAVMVVGLLLVLLGAWLAWQDHKVKTKGLASEFVLSLSELMKALAKHPLSIRLVVLGIVLVFLGGLISGVSGLQGAETPAVTKSTQ